MKNKLMMSVALASWAMASAGLQAKELTVKSGQSIQAVVEKAEAGDLILVEPGVYHETVFIDKENITLRGISKDNEKPTIDGENKLNDGILASGHGVVIDGFRVIGYKGNAIMTQGANNFQIINNFVEGAFYGIFPQFGKNGLVKGNTLTGAEDAGIYVGMSDNVDVVENIAYGNVIGIEMENTREALVINNKAYKNTNGIFINLVPGLPVKTTKGVYIRNNIVEDNNIENFAPASSIAATVPKGVGVMVVGGDNVTLENNVIKDNHSAGLLVLDNISAGMADDPGLDPYPDNIHVLENEWVNNGEDPAGAVKAFTAATGKKGFEVIASGKEKDSCLAEQEGVDTLGTQRWGTCVAEMSIAQVTTVRPEKPIESEPMTPEQKGRFTYLAVCSGCHSYGSVLHGPSMQSVQELYKGNPDGLAEYAAHPVRRRDDFPMMPPQAYLGRDTLKAIAHYILNELGN